MERERLAELLEAVRCGACPVDEALDRLRALPYEDLGFARLDHHRSLRNGFPEVVFGEGKTTEQIIAIAGRLAAASDNVLITRLAPGPAEHLLAAVEGFEYHALPRVALRRARPIEPREAEILVGQRTQPVQRLVDGTRAAPDGLEQLGQTLAFHETQR